MERSKRMRKENKPMYDSGIDGTIEDVKQTGQNNVNEFNDQS